MTMRLQYHAEVTLDAADQMIFEESPNYGDAFICLAIGVVLLALALTGIRLGVEDLTHRKLLSTLLFSGFCFCCISVTYFIKSKIVFDREQQTLTVRRSLLGLGWAHQYGIGEIEKIFEGDAREKGKRLLAMELTSGRTKKLTLWAKRASLSSEETQPNSTLQRFREFSARKSGRIHKPATDDDWWAHTKENASVDLRKHLKRTLYTLISFIATGAAVVPFLAGNPLHEYWYGMGTVLLLASMALWLLLILFAVFTYSSWKCVKDLKKIEGQSGTAKE